MQLLFINFLKSVPDYVYYIIAAALAIIIMLIIVLSAKKSNKAEEKCTHEHCDCHNHSSNESEAENEKEHAEEPETATETEQVLDEQIVEVNETETQKEETQPEQPENKTEISKKEKLNRYRVTYDKDRQNWVVKMDGATRASKRCSTKEEALKVAKELAKKKDSKLSVHKKDGKFQKKANI